MEQYIPKASLVAEIEKRIKSVEKRLKRNNSYSEEGVISWERDKSLYDSYNQFLSFINTLEVKEVDLERLIQKAFIYHESHGDDFRSDCQIETAFRTGFEDGFKCKGYISKIQENNLKEEIKRYFNEQPIMTRSKGVDYKLIPSAEKIAKHFFELGLNASNPLTWEDIKLIWNITDEMDNMPEEEFYKEVLKRFKAQKGEKV